MAVEDMFSVRNQVVCVSGASRRLGKGFAMMFAERGAHVVIGSHDAADRASAQVELAIEGHIVTSVVADVSDPSVLC